MKLFTPLSIVILLFLQLPEVVAQEEYDQKLDCFTVLVGKDASADGSVMYAHNEDDGGPQVVNYFKVPHQQHQPGETITFRNGGTIPQVKETAAYLWLNLPRMEVSDSYFNEYGVSIASDGCPSREDEPELTDGGLVYWLRRVVAERAHTAREGVKIAGELIDKFGYAASGRTYAIADPNEAWMLAAVYGKHWIAQRVPDDEIAVLPNHYIIAEIDLADTVNFLGSPDIIDYAMARGWYDPETDGPFHFAKAYSNPGSINHPGNTHRRWQGINLVSEVMVEVDDEMPFSVKPAEKISVENLMGILRDHYEGTDLDNSKLYTLGNLYKMNRAPICSGATQYSFISHLRSWMPAELQSVVWVAPYRPDVQAYVPWYVYTEKVPEVYAFTNYNEALAMQYDPPATVFDSTNVQAYWKFKSLVDQVDEDYEKNIYPIQAKWKNWEKEQILMLAELEKSLEGKSTKSIIKSITQHTNKTAEAVYKNTKNMVEKQDTPNGN